MSAATLQVCPMSLRAIRRHHAARLKKARASYWGSSKTSPLSERLVGILTSTPKPCGCWKCNSPRKVFGKPFSQVRLEQDLFYADE